MSTATAEPAKIQFPAKLQPLFKPKRYKIVKGGRGGAKSWGVARALLILGSKVKLRILCAREVQNSLKESVHELLSNQIEALGLSNFYHISETDIQGRNGTFFFYAGLSKVTAASLKSFEGVDICWVEEAQTVPNSSWKVLIPTIRKAGSEIWLTWNPILDTDDTWKRFITNTPEDAIVITINWRDNPWFPDVLDKERLHCKATESAEEYNNIWEGEPRYSVPGAIYATELAAIMREGRYAPCPYDPRLKVHTVWDMGYNDAMAVLLVQRARSEARIIAYYEESFKKTEVWASELAAMKLNWGYDWLPFDGYNDDRHGPSDYKILRAAGRKVRDKNESVPNLGPEIGIRACRSMLSRTYLNKGGPGIDRLVEVLKRYCRNVSKVTNEAGKEKHDEFSHGGAALRYLALVVDKFTNEDDQADLRRPVMAPPRPMDAGMGALG